MDKDSWIILLAFVVIAAGLLIYMTTSGIIYVDWNAVFNVKEYN
jgi:hypothetical protein